MNGGGSLEQVTRLVRSSLRRGAAVDIDGLGVFRRCRDGTFAFQARQRPRVFIAYVAEDAAAADRLADGLAQQALDVWIDRRRLLPGQNWPRAIEHAIEIADCFVACFSRRAVLKRGGFQAELRYALDCAARVPLEQVYFVPVRFEACSVPARITRHYQYLDLFPDWEAGLARLVESLLRRGGAP